jgi:hypothetical protein
MARADFNTEILSSTKKGEELTYNLDNVIDKDFEGPYLYEIGKAPFGVNINKDNTLIIPPNLEFDLAVKVYNENDKPIEAVANTKVVLNKISFDKEKEKFLKNESLVKNLSETKGDWAKIINRSTDKKVDGDVKTPDTASKYLRYGAARPIN